MSTDSFLATSRDRAEQARRKRREVLFEISNDLASDNAKLIELAERMSKTRSKEVEPLLSIIRGLIETNKRLNSAAHDITKELE